MLKTAETVKRHGSTVMAARSLKISEATVRRRMQMAAERSLIQAHNKSFDIEELPDDEESVDVVIERREREFERRYAAQEARRLVKVKVPESGPFGLMFFGDLHIDSPGCNIPLLRRHVALLKESQSVYGIAIGDINDNWVGRLARLWSMQGITARQAVKLAEWFINETESKLIAIIEGNHDAWAAGVTGISPLEWIAGRVGVTSQKDGIRLSIESGDAEPVIINARHDFRGRSQYNNAHGMTKAAMFGWRDDIVIGGHTHAYGYNPLKDPRTGRVTHALRIASYKHIDPYKDEQGLPDENISECPIALIDPAEPDMRHRILIEPNPFRGAKVLLPAMIRAAAKRK